LRRVATTERATCAANAIELALKARVSQTLNWAGFPETAGEFRRFESLKTHNLDVLLRFSGVESRILTRYFIEWSAFADWNPEVRYRVAWSNTRASALGKIRACRTLLGAIR